MCSWLGSGERWAGRAGAAARSGALAQAAPRCGLYLHPQVDRKCALGFPLCPVSTLLRVTSLLNGEVKSRVHREAM